MNMHIKSSGLDRQEVIGRLRTLRQQWEQASQDSTGLSLSEVEGNVALLLADITTALELTQQERASILGSKLFKELLTMDAVSNNGSH